MVYYDYTKEEYKIKFYIKTNGRIPAREFLESLPEKHQAKIAGRIELLRQNKGILGEPYAKHIRNKLWELRIDFGREAYRFFYCMTSKRRIVILSGFKKKSNRTPDKELEKAEDYCQLAFKQGFIYED